MIGAVPAVRNPSVLSIDDDEETGILLAYLLKSQGFETHTAQNADEALEILNQRRFDLIVLDVWMPKTNGYDLCRSIRQIDSTTPIIFYSADAYPDNIQAGLAAGANAYVPKPDFDEFLATMHRLLNNED